MSPPRIGGRLRSGRMEITRLPSRRLSATTSAGAFLPGEWSGLDCSRSSQARERQARGCHAQVQRAAGAALFAAEEAGVA